MAGMQAHHPLSTEQRLAWLAPQISLTMQMRSLLLISTCLSTRSLDRLQCGSETETTCMQWELLHAARRAAGQRQTMLPACCRCCPDADLAASLA